MLNVYFSNVFTIDNGILPSSNGVDSDKYEITQRSSDFRVTLTERCIVKAIDRLKNKSSSGYDGLPSFIFKKLKYAIALPLLLIFRRSLDECQVPWIWKVAIVVPIYKKGDKSNPSNYRPISLTSIACKVLERVVADEITAYLTFNKIISINQHAWQV